MATKLIEKINKANLRKDELPRIKIGDNVKVSVRIKEGGKERIQVFSGVVIARKGGGATETITVRRVSFGEGMERVFPLHSPSIAKIVVESSSQVRRAKLYFLRERSGKVARLKMADA